MTPHLDRLVEDAAADLHHFQVLLLLVPGALDVSHPAALILLAGVDEVTHRAVFIEHLEKARKQNKKNFSTATRKVLKSLTLKDLIE